MEKCMNFERNNTECCCSAVNCERHGRCCDCIRAHREGGSVVACMRPDALKNSKVEK